MANPYIKTDAKKWTREEEEKLLHLKKQKSIKEIAFILDRSEVSVSIKYKRLNKKNKTYNEKHLEEKNKLNEDFLKIIKPKTILDVFSGEKSFYTDKCQYITTNDINKDFKTHYNMDYLSFLSLMYSNNKKYDLIDLDPFGSAFDGFDLAIKMAKKGLIVTLGELGHKRFKRLDFVKYRYDIYDLNDFTVENLIEKIKKIGFANKKELKVVFLANWDRISRVYFEINDFKITEQWENKKENTIFDMEDF